MCSKPSVSSGPMTSAQPSATKSRSIRTHKNVLCKSPKTKSSVIKAMLSSPSRKTRHILQEEGILYSTEKEKKAQMGLAILSDAAEVMSALKHRRTLISTSIRETSAAVLIGDRVKKERIQKRVSRELFVSKLQKKAHKSQVRINLIVGNDAVIHDVQRKIRCLKIPEEWRNQMTNYWCTDGSHPTTDTTKNK